MDTIFSDNYLTVENLCSIRNSINDEPVPDGCKRCRIFLETKA